MIYEGALTEAFKEIILNELYDTGDLYESLQIYSEERDFGIWYLIQCEEYIIYHIERLNLIERLSEFPEFQASYEKYVQYRVDSSLEISLSSVDAPEAEIFDLLPQVFVSINGN